MCDFSTGFRPPEMVKVRPAVVVSNGRVHADRLATVVPISSTPPDPLYPWHIETTACFQLTDQHTRHWAKCNLVYTMSFDRLDRPHRRYRGHRRYENVFLDEATFEAVVGALAGTIG